MFIFKKKKFIQIKQNNLKYLREQLHSKQNGICPILNMEFDVENMVVDHKHKKRSTPIGVNGAGLIRGVIHRQANSLEGKFINAFIRYGLDKYITMPEFLRNLADYLERTPTKYIHPSEVVPNYRYIQLASYKELVAALEKIKYRGLLPGYPKNKKMKYTVKMEALYKRTGIIPKFYKGKLR